MKEKECTCPIFRALEKQGLRWNPETEEIETKRWRAKEFERYYFVDNVFGIFSHREVFDSTDDGLWNSGNYFRTEDEARKICQRVQKDVARKNFRQGGMSMKHLLKKWLKESS